MKGFIKSIIAVAAVLAVLALLVYWPARHAFQPPVDGSQSHGALQFLYPGWAALFNVRLSSSLSFNFFLHLCNGIGFFLLVLALAHMVLPAPQTFGIAAVASAIFFLHPAHIWAVLDSAWGQRELLTAMVVLWAILGSLWIARSSHAMVRGAALLVLFAIATVVVGAHGTALLLPALFIAVDWLFVARGDWQSFKGRTLWYALLALGGSAFWLYENGLDASVVQSQLQLKLTRLTQHALDFVSFGHVPVIPTDGYAAILSLVVIFAAVALALFSIKRNIPLVTFGVTGFFAVSLLGSSGAAPFFYHVESGGYLSMLFLTMVVAPLVFALVNNVVERVGQQKLALPIQQGVITVFLLSLGSLSIQRGMERQSGSGFWSAVAKRYPGSPAAQDSYGMALMEGAPLLLATQQFMRALELEPNLALAHEHMGYCFARWGRVSEAIASLSQALLLSPQSVRLYNGLVQLLFRVKRYEPIEKLLVTAMNIDPRNKDTLINCARLYLGRDDSQRAWQALHSASYECGQPDTITLGMLGSLSLAMKRYDDARHAFEKRREINDNDPETLLGLAAADQATNRYGEAAELYERVLTVQPNNRSARLSLAECLYQSGNARDALEIFQTIGEPGDRTKFRIVACYERLGDPRRASQELETMLAGQVDEKVRPVAEELLGRLRATYTQA